LKVRITQIAACLAATLYLAVAAFAQSSMPGPIAGLEFQTPKSGMVAQYEAGRKAKVAWHVKQHDAAPLIVSQVITGEHMGTYIVGRFGMHWADMDKPTVSDADDMAEYMKDVAPYVDKLTSAYYEDLPKISNPSPDMNANYIEIITFHIRYGHNDDFRSAIARVHEANQKLNVPSHYEWHHLVNGGPGGEYALTIDHANWASMEDDPAVKPLRDRLREAFGEQEAMSVIERINSAVESTYSDMIQIRPDLSYIPGH
jgi:hypothetical protein